MTKRTIAVFTGKRGGFGAMLGIMNRIQGDPGMRLKIIVSDMHLNPTFGNTVNEVSRSFAVDARIDMGSYGDAPQDRAQALGTCICKLAPVLEEIRPDILLLLGDRGETLAAAMCAAELGIVIAHIQAGDISGGLDDIHRHAITKLSHLHFSQNERQRQRVIRLGEYPDRVWNTGAPYIDNILNGSFPAPDEALGELGLPRDIRYFVTLHHSDSYRPWLSYEHMRAILEALKEREEHAIVIYPCSDPGYGGIIQAIGENKDHPRFHVFESVDALTFLGLLRGARALVGNSSSGIIEAPYLRVPFINVGLRQDGREKAANVICCEGNVDDIRKALKAFEDPGFIAGMEADHQPFGDGHACARIFDVLKTVEISPEFFRKRIAY